MEFENLTTTIKTTLSKLLKERKKEINIWIPNDYTNLIQNTQNNIFNVPCKGKIEFILEKEDKKNYL